MGKPVFQRERAHLEADDSTVRHFQMHNLVRMAGVEALHCLCKSVGDGVFMLVALLAGSLYGDFSDITESDGAFALDELLEEPVVLVLLPLCDGHPRALMGRLVLPANVRKRGMVSFGGLAEKETSVVGGDIHSFVLALVPLS